MEGQILQSWQPYINSQPPTVILIRGITSVNHPKNVPKQLPDTQHKDTSGLYFVAIELRAIN